MKKKRKRNLLVLPALAVIAFSIFSGFTMQSESDFVKDLLSQRTWVLQKSYYGELTESESESKLCAIETYPLLSEDVLSLGAWKDTQLDIVKNMYFLEVEKNKDYLGYQTYIVSISWDMEGLSERYTMHGDYHVVLKKEGEQYKLSQFDPL